MADFHSTWHTHLRTIAVANKQYTIDQLSQIDVKHIMQDIKDQVSKTFTVRKTAAVALLVTMTALGGTAVHETVGKTDLYYQVYLDGQYVGMVKQPDFVYDKIAALGDRLKASVKLVPVHQRTTGGPAEAEVALAMNQAANPQVEAVMIRVDGQDVAAVKDMATAHTVIDRIKAKFASGDNAVKQVKIEQTIDFLATHVNRDEVRSVDSVVAMLLQSKEKPKKYLVSRGESLWTIAMKNQLTVDKLKAVNPQISNENALQEGQEITIGAVEPLVTVETVEEITRTVPIPFETEYQDDDSMNKGEQRVVTEGQPGEKTQKVQILKKNGQVYGEVVLSEQVTKEKVNKVVVRGTKIPDQASGDWFWPVASHTISSYFGEWRGNSRHWAIDISAPIGTPVYASNNGRVIYAGWDGSGYGNAIRISHGNGIVSIYGHLSSINVSVGQLVSKGEVIGGVGSTGQSTGPHLHYEVQVNGVRVNPAPYM
ncbi:M23 family metallopeptidase [Effusibacillus pohliae]|uniref:M23 family metallopeptidase n=1 Tax=Effusibacillus pohliae TaxID=232270 RepID=UPI000361BED9|nr:M23 family metallopeptidase [Effusibacillus pohliae]